MKLIKTRRMVARTQDTIDPQVKVCFPMSETSGPSVTDVVGGVVLQPYQPPTYTQGAISFTIPNAVQFVVPGAYVPLAAGVWPTFDLSKVICQCGVVRTLASGNGSNLMMGAPAGGWFDVAFGSNGMHQELQIEVGQSVVGISPDATKILPNNQTFVVYQLWDGTSNTILAKALDTSGNVVLSQTGSVGSRSTDVFTPAPNSRLGNGGMQYYSHIVYQWDSVPTNLELGMRWMADLHATGESKRPFIFDF